MTWTTEQFQRIEHLLTKQRGHVVVDHFTFLNALQYVCENGCRWRALPEKFGKWSTIYGRFRYWIDHGAFDRYDKLDVMFSSFVVFAMINRFLRNLV